MPTTVFLGVPCEMLAFWLAPLIHVLPTRELLRLHAAGHLQRCSQTAHIAS